MPLLPALGLTSLCTLAAAAPAETFELDWRAPPECPQRAEVVTAALALLGEVAGDDDDEPRSSVRARGQVEAASGGGYILTFGFEGTDQRVVPGETCESIAEVAALLLAIAIDPSGSGEDTLSARTGEAGETGGTRESGETGETRESGETGESESKAQSEGAGSSGTPATPRDPGPALDMPAPRDDPSKPEPEPEDTWSSAEPDADDPPAATAERTRPRWGRRGASPAPTRRLPILSLAIQPGLSLGVLPSPAPFGELRLGIERGRGRAELYGSYAGPSRELSAINPEIAGRFDLWSGGARGCGVLFLGAAQRGRLSAPLCAGLAIGAMRGRGEGALIPHSATSVWIGATLAAALRTQLHRRVSLLIEAEGLLSLLRPSFHTDPSGPLWQASRVGGRLGIALEFRFSPNLQLDDRGDSEDGTRTSIRTRREKSDNRRVGPAK